MREDMYQVWRKEYETFGGGSTGSFYLSGRCLACRASVAVPESLPEGERKTYAKQNVKHSMSEDECWQEFLAQNLGVNFRLYPNVDAQPWGSGYCSWKEFADECYGSFEIRQLKAEEKTDVAQVWREGFPELFRGTYGFVHDPTAYEMFFSQEWRMFVFVKENRIAGAWLLRMDQLNLSADFALVVVHPDFRGHSLLHKTSRILDAYLGDCGVELTTVACATFHTATRQVFRKLGFQPVGILQGAIRANVQKLFYRRDSVELLYKLYGDAPRIVPPTEDVKTVKAFKFIYRVCPTGDFGGDRRLVQQSMVLIANSETEARDLFPTELAHSLVTVHQAELKPGILFR